MNAKSNPAPSIPKLLGVVQAAKLLRVGQTKVQRLAHEGRLDGYDIAGTLRISEESIVRYLDESRIGPGRRLVRS